MATVTVSDKGQVVIPAEIRRKLGIKPGSRLDIYPEGQGFRVELHRQIEPTRVEEGYGMLVCNLSGERHLTDFDVASAMRKESDDRG